MKMFRNIKILLFIVAVYSCSEKKVVDLGNGYRFEDDPVISMDKVILGPYKNTYAVGGHIINYNFDSIYIIAEQKPRDLFFKSISNESKMTFYQEEKKFKASTLRQYWIINKIKNITYGPYTKEEFQQKREELGVPKKLQLKE